MTMPSRLLPALLLFSTLVSVQAKDLELTRQYRKLHRGSHVLVFIRNRSSVVGRVAAVTDTQLALEPINAGGSPQYFLFGDIFSIRRIRDVPKPVQGLISVPVAVVCGVQRVFSKNACDEL